MSDEKKGHQKIRLCIQKMMGVKKFLEGKKIFRRAKILNV